MGFALPGVAFTSIDKKHSKFGPRPFDGIAWPHQVRLINHLWCKERKKFQYRDLQDLILPKSLIISVERSIRQTTCFYCIPRIDKIIRYLYALDRIWREQDWRLDNSLSWSDAVRYLKLLITRYPYKLEKLMKSRKDGRYLLKIYNWGSNELLNGIPERWTDNEGIQVKDYPGVYTKNGKFWITNNAYKMQTQNKLMKNHVLQGLKNNEMPSSNKSILESMPPEILIRILSLTNNHKVLILSKYFYDFIDTHHSQIVHTFVKLNFTYRFSLFEQHNQQSLALLHDDSDHYAESLSLKYASTAIQLVSHSTPQDLFNKSFITTNSSQKILYKSCRYQDSQFFNVITVDAFLLKPYMVGKMAITFQLLTELKIDFIVEKDNLEEFKKIYQLEVNSLVEKHTLASKLKKKFKIHSPFTITRDIDTEKSFNNLMILTDMILNRTRFHEKVETIIYQLLYLAVKSNVIIPIDIIKDYIDYELKTQHEQTYNRVNHQAEVVVNTLQQNALPEINGDDQQQVPTSFESLLFKNPHLYLLIENQPEYAMLISHFHGPHLEHDFDFWTVLKPYPLVVDSLLNSVAVDMEILGFLAS